MRHPAVMTSSLRARRAAITASAEPALAMPMPRIRRSKTVVSERRHGCFKNEAAGDVSNPTQSATYLALSRDMELGGASGKRGYRLR
jgi:hypothetical protein